MREEEVRINLINDLSEIIMRLTDKEFPMSIDYARGRCFDIYSNDEDYKIKEDK